jgi:hypothetical protein
VGRLREGLEITAPNITSISPISGPYGTAVTVTGTNFGATQGSSTVAMGIFGMPVVSWSDTKIVADVPTNYKAGDQAEIIVAVNGVGSNASQVFSVTSDSSGSSNPQFSLQVTETVQTAVNPINYKQ